MEKKKIEAIKTLHASTGATYRQCRDVLNKVQWNYQKAEELLKPRKSGASEETNYYTSEGKNCRTLTSSILHYFLTNIENIYKPNKGPRAGFLYMDEGLTKHEHIEKHVENYQRARDQGMLSEIELRWLDPFIDFRTTYKDFLKSLLSDPFPFKGPIVEMRKGKKVEIKTYRWRPEELEKVDEVTVRLYDDLRIMMGVLDFKHELPLPKTTMDFLEHCHSYTTAEVFSLPSDDLEGGTKEYRKLKGQD